MDPGDSLLSVISLPSFIKPGQIKISMWIDVTRKPYQVSPDWLDRFFLLFS